MLKKYSICLIAAFSFFLWIEDDSVHSRSTEPPAFNSGAAGQSNCGSSGCHGTADVNSAGGSVIIAIGDGSQTEYLPTEVVDVEVMINESGSVRHGFQMVALDIHGESVGSFITDGATVGTQISQGIEFVNHLNAPNPNPNSFSFQYEMPELDGLVTFHATGLAGNGNGGPSGDNRYTTSTSVDVLTPLGIQDDLANFEIYPNPATDAIILDRLPFDNVNLSISDLNGRTVLNGNFQSNERVDLTDLTVGLYLLTLEVDSYRMTQKLIVK